MNIDDDQDHQNHDKHDHLVGGLEHVLFVHILEIIIPIDELIFFRGVLSTTNQINRLSIDYP